MLFRSVAEHTLVVRNQTVLSRFLRQITEPLLYTTGQSPVRFASKDNGLVLVEASVGSDNIYNTLRLETKERAAKEIVATILPAIKQFRGISVPDVKSFGVEHQRTLAHRVLSWRPERGAVDGEQLRDS